MTLPGVRPDEHAHAPPRAGVDWRLLHRLAREHFDVRAFRPGQRELIEAVLAGRDAIGLLPTGGGKSLTYQLPALVLPGTIVVVSPLIALMQDQQEKLEEADIPAAKLDSTLTEREERKAVRDIRRGKDELVFVTPERLENPEYLDVLKRAHVSLVVVDEAHCVSQWGHDFRPAYLALRDAIRDLGRPPVLALTATATPEVLADIVRALQMQDPVLVQTSVERKNLALEVRRTVNQDAKREALLELVRGADGPGIVYVATVKTCDELWKWLQSQGIEAGRYHGQLKHSEREEMQSAFMEDRFQVMVATNAFGLGIDKPNLRFVVHYQFPASLEAYYQEVGRAGRDGRPARAVLLYRLEDKRIQSYFLGGKYPHADESRRLWQTLEELWKQEPAGVQVKRLAERAGEPERRVKVIAAQLEAAGIVERRRGKILRLRGFESPEEFDLYLHAYEERRLDDRERLDEMMHYAQGVDCRMQHLAGYFGEDDAERCGRCDNCLLAAEGKLKPRRPPRTGALRRTEQALAAMQAREPRFHPGEHVRHRSFGDGEVLEAGEDTVTVRFAKAGERRVREGYLKPA